MVTNDIKKKKADLKETVIRHSIFHGYIGKIFKQGDILTDTSSK